MGRNYLTGRDGDRINAVLAAAGYNFSLLLRWFEELLRVLSLILWHALLGVPLHLTRCRKTSSRPTHYRPVQIPEAGSLISGGGTPKCAAIRPRTKPIRPADMTRMRSLLAGWYRAWSWARYCLRNLRTEAT